jgi:LacI family transcriptional regulator, galactose operon repressor
MSNVPKIILMLEPLGGYVKGILEGILKYSNIYGPWAFYREPEGLHGILPYLDMKKADGMIGFVSETKYKDHAKKIIKSGIPTIAIEYEEQIKGLPEIKCDSYAVGKMVAEYFLERGFVNFAYCGISEVPCSLERKQGFSETITQAGYETFFYEHSRHSWFREKCQWDWLTGIPKPLALMGYNDNCGRFAIEACKNMGLRIPDDIAVMGTDNDEFVTGLASPPLSSVVLGTEKAGYQAAELLDKLMSGKEKNAEQKIIVKPTHVVTRQSTDIIAISDAETSKAIQFIREHSREAIQVAEVADSVALSRRALEKRFNKYLGRSIHYEIKRVRIKEIKRMLIETALPVSRIAMLLGFPDTNKISRYFREEMGQTPLAFRRRHTNG